MLILSLYFHQVEMPPLLKTFNAKEQDHTFCLGMALLSRRRGRCCTPPVRAPTVRYSPERLPGIPTIPGSQLLPLFQRLAVNSPRSLHVLLIDTEPLFMPF